MKTIEIKNLNEIPEEMSVGYMEQTYEFQIIENGYLYESTIERDYEGNITDSKVYGILTGNMLNWDTEDNIAYIFNKDNYEWINLDQKLFDADINETFTYYVDVENFMKNNFFEDKEIEFIKEHEEDGYMKIYITVTSNTVIEEE